MFFIVISMIIEFYELPGRLRLLDLDH